MIYIISNNQDENNNLIYIVYIVSADEYSRIGKTLIYSFDSYEELILEYTL